MDDIKCFFIDSGMQEYFDFKNLPRNRDIDNSIDEFKKTIREIADYASKEGYFLCEDVKALEKRV